MPKISATTLNKVAQAVELDVKLVRDILTEKPGVKVDKNTLDLVFRTAREMGYDFKKLRIGKRMNLRKEVIFDLIEQIEVNPKWQRREILTYMKRMREIIERVDRRTFQEEFGR